MPTSPVKTRIPLTSFGHLITEVKGEKMVILHNPNFWDVRANNISFLQRQLFGIKAPSTVQFTGWRKHFNSYTLQGRRNFVLATYGIIALSASVYMLKRSSKDDKRKSQTVE